MVTTFGIFLESIPGKKNQSHYLFGALCIYIKFKKFLKIYYLLKIIDIILNSTRWTYIFIKVILYALANGTYYGMWDEISIAIKIFQTLGYIEVVHCIVKLVRSSPLITFLQITSRVMVVWGIITSVPEVANTIGVPLLLVAWCMAEIIRYSYYATTILNCCPYILIWCR
ncbi:very-long-chain (3R)-3-hydroxyacyl-CoA dehydratase hpo-8-like [Centruroides sculpturatus]|uniref:very-long-chain (3R)-3-hydroxyacyl-CoA dehydratase hpo-8-like n=1 Tax=Centruroides sculpturatus TaxID=218467 RepID=UPI000C6D66AF|nr:very-long-chain (3R)-3-hydroxyacyl-CoA dehydratase hpo-8-like [Centruroides sculpturatus]